MKFSKYTFSYPYDGNLLALYNAYSNALALIEHDKYAHLGKLCEQSIIPDDSNWISELVRGHFIIDDNLNELELLRLRLLQSRFSSSTLTLTIAPTSDCNFKCVYCFEKGSTRETCMSKNVQERVVSFVNSKMEGIRSLQVPWYGGESLLALPVIESLTSKFMTICSAHNVEYRASIITNGYLLTPEVARQFADMNITGVQVTVDGSESEHNKRRPLADGGPTYRKIMDNLVACKGIFAQPVSLRINVDKKNEQDASAVLNELRHHQMEGYVRPYIGHIMNINGKYADGICYDSQEFSELELRFLDTHNRILEAYPVPKGCYCCADSASSSVINADGKMYRCWSDIGIESRSYYDLAKEMPTGNYDVANAYLLYDPTRDDECRSCKYLPLCMGGCPDRRLRTGERCASVKYNLDAYMTRIPYLLRN